MSRTSFEFFNKFGESEIAVTAATVRFSTSDFDDFTLNYSLKIADFPRTQCSSAIYQDSEALGVSIEG